MTFEELFHATYGDLLRFIQRRVDLSRAEDVAADVWLVAWRRRPEIPQREGPARAWLFGVARRTLLTAYRGDSRREALAVRIADDRSSGVPERQDDQDLVVLRVDLQRAWSRLTPSHQEALALHHWDGLSTEESARVLEISPVAYRLRLSRARRALRALVSAPATASIVTASSKGNFA